MAIGKVNTVTVPSNRNVLYNNGNENTNVTGGWSVNGYSWSASSLSSGTKTATTMQVYTATNGTTQILGTQNLIDITNKNTIHINVTEYVQGTHSAEFIYFSKTKTNPYLSADTFTKHIDSTGELEFDISDKTGEYYIFLFTQNAGSKFVTNKIWLD